MHLLMEHLDFFMIKNANFKARIHCPKPVQWIFFVSKQVYVRQNVCQQMTRSICLRHSAFQPFFVLRQPLMAINVSGHPNKEIKQYQDTLISKFSLLTHIQAGLRSSQALGTFFIYEAKKIRLHFKMCRSLFPHFYSITFVGPRFSQALDTLPSLQ